MRIMDLMNSRPHIARLNDTLAEAAVRMRQHAIKRLPVIDDEQHLYGIIAVRDIDRVSAEAAKAAISAQLESRQVRTLMTRRPITCLPQAPARAAAALMLRNRIGFLPVVEETRLIGIVTTSDVLRAAATFDLTARQDAPW